MHVFMRAGETWFAREVVCICKSRRKIILPVSGTSRRTPACQNYGPMQHQCGLYAAPIRLLFGSDTVPMQARSGTHMEPIQT
jgi:hypothetical protein